MHYWSVLIFVLIQAPKPAPLPGVPAAPGVYCHQDDAQWAKIEPAVMADMKSKGMGDFLETNGYTNLNVTATFPAAQAKVQISALRPVFCVRGTGSAKDAMIVQLTRKKDSRTIRTSSSAATVDNKGGFSKSDIRPVTVTVYSDDSFSITPEQDLKPGEYLLVFSYANSGFDFGIKSAKK